MRALLAIVKREFFAYFFSPLAYVVLTGFLLINGMFFSGLVRALASNPEFGREAFIQLLFTGVFFWIYMMVVCSVIAMRLIAEERKSGSIETLLTAPVDEATVVVGKFLGAWAFLLFLWVPTLAYPLILSRFGRVEWGAVAGGYLGVALLGGLFISAGTFASALTKNQIVAAMLGFVFIIICFMPALFREFYTDTRVRETLAYVSLVDHMEDFARGIVDSRRVVYNVTAVIFFLFLGTKALEANKGK